MVLLLVICVFVGISVAIKTSLIIQVILAIAGILYCNTWAVRSMEIGALLPMSMVGLFISGMALGDLYYLIAYVPDIGGIIQNAVSWLFKP